MADERLTILVDLPIKHKEIIHEPMLEEINIEKYLATGANFIKNNKLYKINRKDQMKQANKANINIL